MTRHGAIAVIRGRIDSTAALRDVARKAPDLRVVLERSVLYPYIRFDARCTVPTIGGRKTVSLDCLVDGINGHGMTAENFSTDKVLDPDGTKLQPEITDSDARRNAKRTVMHGLGRKLKMIARFDVRVEEKGAVYRRFWIVRVGDNRVMVDSVTGDTHPVCASAA